MSTHDHRLEHTVGHGAPTQVAPADPSVPLRPQTDVTQHSDSDTHTHTHTHTYTHTQLVCTWHTCHLEQIIA